MHKIKLNPAHRWLVNYFEPPYAWFDCINFSLQEPICKEKLKKSIYSLVQRHDGLRTTFEKEGQQWVQNVHPSLSEFLLDPIFVNDDNKLAYCQTFDIGKLPLFRLLIQKKSETQFDFSFIFHHIIVDYVSLVLFFKEFYQHYKGISFDDKLPTTNFGYAQAIEKLEISLPVQKVYTSPFINFPSKAADGHYVKRTLPIELVNKLQRHGKKHFKKASLHAILTAPLYRALSNKTNSSEIVVSHKLHGREPVLGDSRFFSAIGNFAINVPVACHVDGEAWQDLIDHINLALESDPTKGLYYDLKENDPDQHKATVRFNFLGTISFEVPSDLKVDFHRFAHRISPPDQKLTAYIEFFVYICEKQLFIEVCTDSHNVSKLWSEELINLYVDNLKHLILTIEEK